MMYNVFMVEWIMFGVEDYEIFVNFEELIIN